MKIFVSVLFLFLFKFSNAQNEVFDLIQDVFNQWQKYSFNDRRQCKTIYINDSLDPIVIKGLKERLSEQKKFYRVDAQTRAVDSFELDDSEVEFIMKEADRLNSNRWSENIFPNARIIHPSEFEKHFKPTEFFLDPMEKLCYNVYTFSNPIFLRNQTVCLFYNEERTFYNMSGEFSLYVYRKKKWHLFSLVCKHREVRYGDGKKPNN